MTKQELRTALESGEPVYVMKDSIVCKIIKYHIHHNTERLRLPVTETIEVKWINRRSQFHRHYGIDSVELLTPEKVVLFKLMGIITE